MHILVTGGAGFIGSHLSERLIHDGHSVTVLDDLSTGQMSNLTDLVSHPKFEFVEGTILDRDLLMKLVEPAGVVFHLAAAVGVKLIMDEPSRSILTNVSGTENVLDAALKTKAHTFIASSSEVYGKTTNFPFREDGDLTIGATKNLRWSYACAKTLDEFLALAHARESALPVTILRFFNTAGPRQTGRYGMVIPNFVKSAIEGRPLMVHGTGEQSRCFGHVQDAVEAMCRLMATPKSRGEVFNVGTDQESTIRQLAELVIEATGSKSEIQLIPYEEVYPEGFEDMERRLPAMSKLEAAVGFRPMTSLRQIVEDVIADVRVPASV